MASTLSAISRLLLSTVILILLGPRIAFEQSERPVELVVQTGHTLFATSVAFSPDGKRIASAGVDGAVRLWDTATGRELRKFAGSGVDLDTVAFGPTGDIFAAGGGDATVLVWDLKRSLIPTRLKGHSLSITSVAFSPSGDLIASTSWDRSASLWNSRTGEEETRLLGHTGLVLSAAFDPKGRWIVTSGSDRTIRLWDVSSGRQIGSIRTPTVINSVAASPDGRTIAGAGRDGIGYVWSRVGRRLLRKLTGHTGEIRSVAFDRSGKRIATASADGTARVWNLATGRSDVLKGHDGIVSAVAFNPNTNSVATAGQDRSIRIWDLPTKNVLTLSGHSSGVNSAVISPSGKTIASVHADGALRIWANFAEDIHLRTLVGVGLSSLALSPDGGSIAATTLDEVSLIDVVSGKVLQKHQVSTRGALYTAFSPTGDIYAVGATNVQAWDVKTGEEVANFRAHEGNVYAISFSHSGRLLATGSLDGVVRLWDTQTWEKKREFTVPPGYVSSISFSPDDRILAAAANKEIFAWDTATGEQRQRIPGAEEGSFVSNLKFSPDGRTIASTTDNRIELRDVVTGSLKKALVAHEAAVSSVDFSMDGKMLVSSSIDSTIRFWDTATGQQVISLVPLEGDAWVVATPEGRFDTNTDLDRIDRLAWRFSEEPLAPRPLSLFMRQYYEPGLLRRVLSCHFKGPQACRKEFKPIPPVGSIDRVQTRLAEPTVGNGQKP